MSYLLSSFIGALVGITLGFIPGLGLEILFLVLPGLGIKPTSIEWLIGLLALSAFMQTSQLISLKINPLARFDLMYMTESLQIRRAESLGRNLKQSLITYREGMVIGTLVSLTSLVVPQIFYQFPFILTLSLIGVPLLWAFYISRIEKKVENVVMGIISALIGLMFSVSGLSMPLFFVAFFNAPLTLMDLIGNSLKKDQPPTQKPCQWEAEPNLSILIGAGLSSYLMGWPTSVFGRALHQDREPHPQEASLLLGFEYPVMLGMFIVGGLSRGDISEMVNLPSFDSPLIPLGLIGIGTLFLYLSLQLSPWIVQGALSVGLKTQRIGALPVAFVSVVALLNSPKGFLILFPLGLGYHLAAQLLGIRKETSLACVSWLPILKNLPF